MGQIRLNGMEFYAYHGCYHEEQVIGNHFVVDLVMVTDMEKPSDTDRLSDALNYAEAYEIVKQEMNIRSHLLEHICNRILNKLFIRFPQLEHAEIQIAKLTPPLGGQVRNVCVRQQKKR